MLDGALGDVQAETVENLQQVLKVTQVAYSASQVTQTDFISAEFDFAAARQQQQQLRTAEANDETTINQLLYRRPDEPLNLDRNFELQPLTVPLDQSDRSGDCGAPGDSGSGAGADQFRDRAASSPNSNTRPTIRSGFIFDNYLLSSAAPSPTAVCRTDGFTITFNLPVFFWLKQNEDVKRASYNLEAAREDLDSIRNQTAAIVTTLYRNAHCSRIRRALLYRDSLIPLARQNFQVALIAYESGKIDFVTLASAIRRSYDSRAAYLQAANQFLAAQVALEQAIGEPLEK